MIRDEKNSVRHNGNNDCHICNIYFNRGKGFRKGAYVEAELDLLIAKEELEALSAHDIEKRVTEKLYYDEFEWIKQNKQVRYKSKTMAEGLENRINDAIRNCVDLNDIYDFAINFVYKLENIENISYSNVNSILQKEVHRCLLIVENVLKNNYSNNPNKEQNNKTMTRK